MTLEHLHRLQRVLASAVAGVLAVCMAAGCSSKSDTPRDETARLINDLGDPAPEMRLRAAEELGPLRSKAAVKPLVRCLRDIRADVRKAAARSLGTIGDATAVGPLAAALQDPTGDAEFRKAVAESLGQIGDPAAVPSLAAALQDRDEGVVFAAAYALGRVGLPALDTLIRLAGSTNTMTQHAVATVLGQIPSDTSRDTLRPLLTHADPFVRLAAAESLATLNDRDSAAAIVRLLRDPDRTVRRGAPAVLRKLGPAAAGPLRSVFDGSAVSGEQEMAIDILTQLTDPRAVPALLLASAARVRPADEAEKYLLKLLRVPECRAELLKVGLTGAPAEQVQAIRILTTFIQQQRARAGTPSDVATDLRAAGMPDLLEAVEWFARCLRSPEAQVSFQAARSLGVLGDRRGRDVLLAALRSAMRDLEKGGVSRGVRNPADAVEDCLAALGPIADTTVADEVVPLLKMSESVQKQVGAAVLDLIGRTRDPKYVEILLPLAEPGPRRGLEAAAANALGAIGDKRGFDPIARYLQKFGNHNSHAEIRLVCFRNLFRCDADRAHPIAAAALVAALPHDTKIIEGIAALYEQYPDRRAVAPLVQWVHHDLQSAREAVRRALAKVAHGHPEWLIAEFEVENYQQRNALAGVIADECGGLAVPLLQQAIKDPRPRTRQGAAWTLGCIGGPEAVHAIRIALSDTHPAVRSAAAWAAGRIADPTLVEPLLILLKDADDDVRTMAAKQLGQTGDGRSIEPLLSTLADTNAAVRGSAALSLGRLRAPQAEPALRKLAQDPDPDVRTAVEAALLAIQGKVPVSSPRPTVPPPPLAQP